MAVMVGKKGDWSPLLLVENLALNLSREKTQDMQFITYSTRDIMRKILHEDVVSNISKASKVEISFERIKNRLCLRSSARCYTHD